MADFNPRLLVKFKVRFKVGSTFEICPGSCGGDMIRAPSRGSPPRACLSSFAFAFAFALWLFLPLVLLPWVCLLVSLAFGSLEPWCLLDLGFFFSCEEPWSIVVGSLVQLVSLSSSQQFSSSLVQILLCTSYKSRSHLDSLGVMCLQ